MSSERAREPVLEWALRSASGSLEGLDWVEATIEPDAPAYRVVATEDGEDRFRQVPAARFLPPNLARAARAAQDQGEATAQEGLLLVFAEAEWLFRSLGLLWAPYSPAPQLLASLVESYGIDPALHGGDSEHLASLVALLPRWHPHRGSPERAALVLEACGEGAQADGAQAGGQRPGCEPDGLRDEAFVCRGYEFWRCRASEASPEYVIRGGVMRFQPREGAAFPLRREDVLIPWRAGSDAPRHLIRLLPAWTVVRLAGPEEA